MADRLTGLASALLIGGLCCVVWGTVGAQAQPREAGLLIDRLDAHQGEQGWELQLVQTCLQLRPWHEGYGRCRGALREVGKARLARAAAL